MERNPNDPFGGTNDPRTPTGGAATYGTAGATTGAGATGATGAATGTPSEVGSTGTAGLETTGTGAQTRRMDQAKHAVQDRLGQAKDKARELKSTLADKLDAGADKLRQRNRNAAFAGATTGTAGTAGTADIAADDRMAHMQDSMARGLSKSADYLRNGDLRGDIERQVRENPGRTLLIALGLGYVLGKAFRRDR